MNRRYCLLFKREDETPQLSREFARSKNYLCLTLSAFSLGCGPRHEAVREESVDAGSKVCKETICSKSTQPESMPSSLEGEEDEELHLCGQDLSGEVDKTLYLFDSKMCFPSASFLTTGEVPNQDLSRLCTFLAPDYRLDAASMHKILGVRPVIKIDLSWNLDGIPEAYRMINLDIFVDGVRARRVVLAEGSTTRFSIKAPPLLFDQKDFLSDGIQCNRLRADARVRMVIADEKPVDKIPISLLRSKLVVSASFALYEGDIKSRNEQALDKMTSHARAARDHIRDAAAHAAQAKEKDLAVYLSELGNRVDEKISSSSTESIESFISVEDIPMISGSYISPNKQDLLPHFEALVTSLFSANTAAERSHRFFLQADTVKYLKVGS